MKIGENFSSTFFDLFSPSKQTIFSKKMKLKETCDHNVYAL